MNWIIKKEKSKNIWLNIEYTHISLSFELHQSYVSDDTGASMKPHEDMLIQCTASNALFNQLLTWEHMRKHCSNALMLYYPTKVFTVLQPSHLIKVINLQQLAQKINNWFRCKVPPPSYAACIFILTVNKIGSSANLRKKYTVAHPAWRVFSCVLFQVLSSVGCYFFGAKPYFYTVLVYW